MLQSSSFSASATQPSAAEAVTASPSEVAVETTKPKPKPWLIVGLGNPGKMYSGTRHNVCSPSLSLSNLVKVRCSFSLSFFPSLVLFLMLLCNGLLSRVNWKCPVMLAKPQTFMNASGQSVGAIVSYHKIPLKQVLVIFDDLDLPFAKLRLLPKGDMEDTTAFSYSMRSVIDHFKGSKDFPRLRIGIGRPPGKMNPVSFVMRAFNKQDDKRYEEVHMY
ncbi:hypothetical protein C3L33_04194, partial [Rhododendron williamsianum]